ncbi:hypothetical protein, partial [Cryobacterium roopkundense]
MTTPRIPFDIIDTANGTAVRTSDGVFLRLTGSPIPVWQLHALAGGRDVALDAAGQASWQRVHSAVTTRHEHDAAPTWPTPKSRVLIVCTEPALAHLAADLAELGADVRSLDVTGVYDSVDLGSVIEITQALTEFRPALVIWLAGGLPPRALWDNLDTLPFRGVAWLRVHREGSQLWVDPLSLDMTDPSSAQVMKRRLAASGTAEELASWLEARTNVPTAMSDLAGRMVGLRLLDMAQAWAFDA